MAALSVLVGGPNLTDLGVHWPLASVSGFFGTVPNSWFFPICGVGLKV